MALIKYSIKVPGNSIASYCESKTAGGTFAAMDVVTLSAGTVICSTAADNTAYGIAITSGTAAGECVVLPFRSGVKIVLPTSGTEAVTNVGVMYALSGTTGAQYVNLAETGQDLFTVCQIDITNELAEVTVPSAKSIAETGA